MPKPNNEKKINSNKASENKAKIKSKKDIIPPASESELKSEKDSIFVEFKKRPLPSEREVREFDEYISNEIKEEDLNNSLSEIYQDEKGQSVDVDKIEIKKRGFFSWLLTTSLFLFIVAGSIFLLYNYIYLPSLTDSTAIELSLKGDEEIFVGEEFTYEITYKNNSNVALENVEISVKYPENFIVLDATPGSDNFRKWYFENLDSNFSGKINIRGKIIAPLSYTGIMLADIRYTPANFSSEFKKESSFVSAIVDTGINFNIDYITSMMAGEENNIEVIFKEKDESYIKNFRISFEPLENLDIINIEPGEEDLYKIIRPGVYDVLEIKNGEGEVPLKLRFNDKINDKESLLVNFSQEDSEGNHKIFYSEQLTIDVVKSDLNLTLITNAKRNDQGIGFSEKLNYSIIYSNKGDSEMSDVIIMAVLDSEFLDWSSLDDQNDGEVNRGTITWTKENIPALGELETGEEGFIDFSINVVDKPSQIFPEKNYSIESYAQYRVGSTSAESVFSEKTKSNTIVNKISSDLSFTEQVRYFNDDNISVGSGPIPPKIGQKTDYKIYWEISNNMHELSNVKVSLKLPSYVSFEERSIASIGSVVFSEETNTVEWTLGAMPINIQRASAEFAISVTPGTEDLNKIMILSSGAEITAFDNEANIDLSSSSGAKTTRLEDDSIANSDGIVTN